MYLYIVYLFAISMLKAKNVLMLVVLSAGILTVLTGTGISQVAPAFADKV
jgi:hypothetical protein